MQEIEVEVAPRDVYIHYVHVPKGKTISWFFFTKKKNISFGLFQRITPVATANAFTEASSSTTSLSIEAHLSSSKTSLVTPTKTGTSLHSVASRASVDTIDTIEETEDGISESGTTETSTVIDYSNSSSTYSYQSSSARSGRKKSASAQILGDPDLKELLPIEHFNSASTNIKGSYQVQEEGTYCLCFDNSFSRNTSKIVTLFVSIKDGLIDNSELEAQPEISGWLLKKKRKRMQGWAKRWFQICNGVMSYYQNQQAPCRGVLHIGLSTVSSSATFRSINMDSGTSTYQLKALTDQDFHRWMAVIRKYVNQSIERQLTDPDYPRNLTSPRQSVDLTKRQSLYRRQSSHRPDVQSLFRRSIVENRDDMEKVHEIFGNMDKSFESIKELLNVLKTTSPEPPTPSTPPASQPRSASSSDGRFRIMKFPIMLQKATTIPSSEVAPPPPPPNSHYNMTFDQTYEKLYSLFLSLRTDKEQIHELFKTEVDKWRTYRNPSVDSEDHRKSSIPLGKSADNKGIPSPRSPTFENGISEKQPGVTKSIDQLSERALSLNSVTTNSDVFFDAEDIVLSPDVLTEEDSDVDTAIVEVIEDEESEDDEATPEKPQEVVQIVKEPVVDDHPLTRTISFRRRKNLPSPVCGDDVSLLSILRKNVGKDLTTIAMPISLNEPINLLQRLAEELEYSELLDKAANEESSLNRLIYVAAFAVSGYSSTQHRAWRKPFNPLYGETYECIRPDKGFKYISEKVSHHPPVMACYAESKNWKFWQDSKVKSKFWGKSMELIPSGTVHVTTSKYNDHFTFNKPSTWMRNMISGNRYLEHTGVMRIQNQLTGEACEITFNQSGFFSSGPQNEVSGKLMSANGKKVGTIVGRWNEILFHEIGPNQLEVIWKANPPIPDYELYYGFTQFSIELNELTPDIADYLPNTDTRLRPDQRLFEEGNVSDAEQEKLRVEQRQRDFRKQLEKAGQAWTPQWFHLVNDEWVYTGKYFETRDDRAFTKKVELW